MGCAPSVGQRAVQDSIGAYSYNGGARDCHNWCNWLFCCGKPLWHVPPAACPNCCADGKRFPQNHPEWGKNAALRAQFEELLMGQEMQDALDGVPKCCFCTCISGGTKQLLDPWCSKVNAELLHPAGFQCEAFHWVTKGDKGQDEHHMAVTIMPLNRMMPNAARAPAARARAPAQPKSWWSWKDHHGFVAFDLRTARHIDKAYESKAKGVAFNAGSSQYYIDFRTMKQKNQHTTFLRDVQRTKGPPAGHGGFGF